MVQGIAPTGERGAHDRPSPIQSAAHRHQRCFDVLGLKVRQRKAVFDEPVASSGLGRCRWPDVGRRAQCSSHERAGHWVWRGMSPSVKVVHAMMSASTAAQRLLGAHRAHLAATWSTQWARKVVLFTSTASGSTTVTHLTGSPEVRSKVSPSATAWTSLDRHLSASRTVRKERLRCDLPTDHLTTYGLLYVFPYPGPSRRDRANTRTSSAPIVDVSALRFTPLALRAILPAGRGGCAGPRSGA
jgi:hypothetical protein